MQLNIYVPNDKEPLLEALDETVRSTGRAKNLLVLDALEQYLRQRPRSAPARQLRTFHLGAIEPWRREDLYDERLDHTLAGPAKRVAERKAQYELQS